jgi:hypothetical protein
MVVTDLENIQYGGYQPALGLSLILKMTKSGKIRAIKKDSNVALEIVLVEIHSRYTMVCLQNG